MASPPANMKPPYLPQAAIIGGIPTVDVDIPISAVFLALFLGAAVGHMIILQVNLRRGHKFIMSALMFGFCMARVTTMVIRIAWAAYPTNVRIFIAAMIFISAGVLLLFMINLIFAQRVIRAAHPHFGWNKAFSRAFVVLYVLIFAMFIAVVTATVQSFYTLDRNTLRVDRYIQLTASTYLMVISFLPFPMVIIGLIVPRKTRIEKFGTGRWRTKIRVLIICTVLLCLGATFRAGTAWKKARTRNNPAWYHSKWAYYFFNFTVEVFVIYLYLVLRVDYRFYTPDGASRPGHYSYIGGPVDLKLKDRQSTAQSEKMILSEEELFDDLSPTSQFTLRDPEAITLRDSRPITPRDLPWRDSPYRDSAFRDSGTLTFRDSGVMPFRDPDTVTLRDPEAVTLRNSVAGDVCTCDCED